MNQLDLPFDYDALDGTTRAVVLEARDRINGLIRRTGEALIEIGRWLITVKAALAHGQFGPWIDAEFGWSQDTAERFIKVAKAFADFPQIAEFQPSALYALASGTVPDEIRREFVDRAAAGEVITYRDVRDYLAGGPHVAHNSGDDEWYTPAPIIAAARAVLGTIDLDPASSAEANTVVGATRFYTEADDGLRQPWAGRIWLNPPYRTPTVDRFCSRLVREHRLGSVSAGITIVNNATETAWFQELVVNAGALCFPRGRVRYWHPEKPSVQGLQGQAIFYIGPDAATFHAAFRHIGVVAVPTCELEG